MTTAPSPAQPGTARQITYYGEPVLHRRCRAVTDFDDDLATLVADMFASMYAAKGVGLAANQVGVDAQVFVYDCPDESDSSDSRVGSPSSTPSPGRLIGHVVNPVLHAPKGRGHRDVDTEGCLSIPGQYAELGRADLATVTGFDLRGSPVRIKGTGLLARCFQHEVDHLNGLLYVDHLSRRKRKAILAAASLPA